MNIQENELYSNKRQRGLGLRSRILEAITAILLICVIVLIILMGITMNKAYENSNHISNHISDISPFITDMQHQFNTSIFSYKNGQSEESCHNHKITSVTGQTAIPGHCVTVSPSKQIEVARIATNCALYVYAGGNCTGKNYTAHDLYTGNPNPTCISDPGKGDALNSTYSGDGGFKSFQVLCV